MELVNIIINGQPLSIAKGKTILDAAQAIGVKIPTLCYYDGSAYGFLNNIASCRVCMVEVVGRRGLAPACSTVVFDKMEVCTDSLKAIHARKMMVELLLSNHPPDCLVCQRNHNCELRQLAGSLGVRELKYKGEVSTFPQDNSGPAISKNPDKCVLCRRCEFLCRHNQTVGVYSATGRGFKTTLGTAFDEPLADTNCTYCGQCVAVCPTAALTEADHSQEVWQALRTPGKHVIAQTAPAVRVAIGEEFGLTPGSVVTGQLAAALRRLGFHKVMDTNFTADVTIMEEATEFLHRLGHGGTLPLLTSCCPAWIKFLEHEYPQMLEAPSSCKSPQEMMGALIKSYYAQQAGLDPQDIVVVSIMPCLAKKFEAKRPELSSEQGYPDVDYVLSTRELARMIREAGIEFSKLSHDTFDDPLGDSTGAADIFGSTGGVMEAALRTAYHMATGQELENIEFQQLRGMEGVREATVQVGETPVRVAVASGLGNARQLIEKVVAGEASYHIIEVMACPHGCVSGGGQPYHYGELEVLRQRAAGLYAIDSGKTRRRSHENPAVKGLYENFLGEPGGKRAHQLLHTKYTPR